LRSRTRRDVTVCGVGSGRVERTTLRRGGIARRRTVWSRRTILSRRGFGGARLSRARRRGRALRFSVAGEFFRDAARKFSGKKRRLGRDGAALRNAASRRRSVASLRFRRARLKVLSVNRRNVKGCAERRGGERRDGERVDQAASSRVGRGLAVRALNRARRGTPSAEFRSVVAKHLQSFFWLAKIGATDLARLP